LNILEKIEKNPNIPTRCFDTAEKSDFIFRKVADLQGWNIKKSSDSVDIFDHIDYWVEIPDFLDNKPYNISVDIKSAKKFMINPFLILEHEWIWIEFKNVNGKEGWLYGKADYIVYVFLKEIWFINRKKLINFIPTKLKDEYVDDKIHAHYKLYKRQNRNDLLTLVNLGDIKYELYPNILKFDIDFDK
jgi:hypothetical protein